MKKTASLLLGALMVLVLCSFVPKEDTNYKLKSRYVFGFSFSYSDSSVYFTDVQCLDSVQIGEHGKLVKTGIFSDQLRAYLISKGVPNPTTVIFNEKNEKSANKQMEKVMKKHNDPKINWNVIPQNEFKFKK